MKRDSDRFTVQTLPVAVTGGWSVRVELADGRTSMSECDTFAETKEEAVRLVLWMQGITLSELELELEG